MLCVQGIVYPCPANSSITPGAAGALIREAGRPRPGLMFGPAAAIVPPTSQHEGPPVSRNSLILAAAGGSAALLLGALGFQYIGGLFPCVLCLWQRWPHLVAVILGLIGLRVPGRIVPVLGALAVLTTAGIGMFHVGVEQGWWAGLESCSGRGITGMSTATLLDPTAAAPEPVRCDQIAWSLMGISMAGWNVIASLGLAGLWLAATRKRG